ncbi:MAG: hypothetical protein ABIW82_04880 [Dokdonella sp.]
MNRLLAFVLLLLFSSSGFCMEYTRGFALQTVEGEHVGFVLAAPSFKAESGDCVFTLLPIGSELVHSPLGVAIANRKVAGEHHWNKKGDRIVVSFKGNVVLEFSGKAEILDGSGKVLGRVVPIPESTD